MPIISSAFQPSYRFRNPHIQTLLPALLRQPSIPERIVEKVELNDGDFMEIEILVPTAHQNKTAVLLIHGLTGSADSQYILGIQNLLASQQTMSIAMNFRGAKSANRLALGYHSGSSDDIAALSQYIEKHCPLYSWHVMGFSLGANVLLKYLGEYPHNIFTSAIAVSVPFELDICATEFDKGLSRFYRNHLLKQLKIYLNKKYSHLSIHHPEQASIIAKLPIDKKFTSFWDFDHEIIAPIHGFESAQDYYIQCSSGQFLSHIQTPTHILNALDDPFLSPKIIPKEKKLSKHVTLELSQWGGHVGFYSGNNHYYVEALMLNLLARHAS